MSKRQNKLEYQNRFEKYIDSAQNIAIVGHIVIDADAIHSCLAMYHYINKYFDKNVKIILDGTPQDKRKLIPLYDEIMWVDDLGKELDKYDTVIFLDASELYRFSERDFTEVLEDKTTICYDHHPRTKNYDYTEYYCLPNKASTTHLLAEQIFDIDKLHSDKLLAKFVMWGIMADSGYLQYIDSKSTSVFPVVQGIIQKHDFSIEALKNEISFIPIVELKTMQHLLSNTKFEKLDSGHKIMYSYMNRDYTDELSAKYGDSNVSDKGYKGEYLRNVEGYNFGFVVKPFPEYYIISWRSSKAGVDVSRLAQQLNGGGHVQAASGQVDKDFAASSKEVAERVINMLNAGKLRLVDLVS